MEIFSDVVIVVPKRLLKTKTFEKKAIDPVKKFWTFSSRNIEHEKCQSTVYTGPEGLSTNIVQVIGLIL